MKARKKYECVMQHDGRDCGVACIATISLHYGRKISISKMRDICGTDKNGTSAYGLIKGAKSLGFAVKAVKVTQQNDIFKKIPIPAIAHIKVDGVLLHYVVIHRITSEEIIIADPTKGICRYTPEQFFEIWGGIIITMIPGHAFQKGDETKGLFRRFWGLINIQRMLLVKIFITSIFVTALGIAGSLYYKILIDYLLPNKSNSRLIIISIAITVLFIFKAITEFFRSILLTYMAQNIDIPLLLGYYDHVIELPMNFFGTREVGEIISRFNDGNKIRDAISSATITIMIDVIMAIVGGIILYTQSPKMFVICFIPIIVYLILVFTFKKPLMDANKEVMEDDSKLTSYLVQSIEGIETVKAYNGEKRVINETEKRFMKFMKSIFRYSYLNNIQGAFKSGVKGIFGIIILWIGGYFVLKNQITIGTLISFNALLAYFIEPVERMISLQPQIQSAVVASDRLGEILDLEKEKSVHELRKIKPDTLTGDIILKNVNFRYGTRPLVLKNINMKINSGKKVALVGESGSGKTTIAKIIMSFYEVEDGEVLINTLNIKEINREALRNKISYISQDSFFFSGSVRENLKFAKEDATDHEMIEVCKKAQIHDYICSMPFGYESLLDEGGKNLSGGQRQRLAIARALLKSPEILIMDEATSNLDSITEEVIQETIEECTKNITTIIIAHRLSTIKKCDKIYVMNKGGIIEEGTHKQLINERGYYYKLWSRQT